MDAIHVTPELESGWSWAGDWAATPTLHRALGGIPGGEGWAVKIARRPVDGEVKAALRGRMAGTAVYGSGPPS